MKLVILDRDGVINYDADNHIRSPQQWRPLPGSLEAIAKLNQRGYRIVVCTNQSGIGRGYFSMDTLNAIHEKMIEAVDQAGGAIDAVFFCPHAADDMCGCRKPKPGMLEEIAERYNVSLQGVPFIGDSLRDLQAAVAAGAQPLLVLSGKGEKTREDGELPPQTQIFDDLAAVATALAGD